MSETIMTTPSFSANRRTPAEAPRAARISLYALCAMSGAPVIAMVLWCVRAQETGSILTLLLAAALGTLLLAALTRTWRGFFLAYLPLLLLSVAYVTYALGFGIVPGRTLAILLLSATGDEIYGLFEILPGKWRIALLLGLVVSYLTLAWRLPSWPIFSSRVLAFSRLILVLTVPITLYAAQDAITLVDGIYFNPVVGSLTFLGRQLPRTRAELRGGAVVKTPFHAQRRGNSEEVHVLIVGESVRRGSWSAYGYARPTTPYLDSLRSEAVLLQHAMADANLTSFAMQMMLTGMDPAEAVAGRSRANLLDLAKEAGFSTAWLVNQDILISTAIGIAADRLDFPPDLKTDIFGRHTWDEVLLPAYRREIARRGAARFIGIHMMGSHWEYQRRYPPAFQRFGTAGRLGTISLFLPADETAGDVLDAYDNSVLYTDWFLHQVIEEARRLDVPATVTFFADHGEELQALDGNAGHGQQAYAPREFEIPAFVWVNEAYRKAHPKIVAALQGNASREVRTHNVFYTVAELMGITWPGTKAELSFASEHFVADATMQHVAGGVLVTRR